jgi:hypothetical protein
VAKTPKTPGMTVYLQEEVSADADIAKLVHSMLEYTVLKDIVKLTENLLRSGCKEYYCCQGCRIRQGLL